MNFSWNEQVLSAVLTRKDRLPHALLIRGRHGIGKRAFATRLATALLCESPLPEGAACERCASCGWMGQEEHPDFRLLEPQSQEPEGENGAERREKGGGQITVNAVRGLGDFINLSTHRGGAKVVLIHPAEALNPQAANALLKSLEEPPSRVHFLLVAHRWRQLLATLRSRCQQIALPPPSREAAREWLGRQGLREPDLALAQAGGAPLAAARLDGEYWAQRGALLEALGARGFDPLEIAERLRDVDPESLLGHLQKWSYDISAIQAGGKARYNHDHAAPLAALAKRIDPREAARFLRHLVRLQRVVAHPLNARLFLEALLLGYAGLLRGDAPGR